MLANSHARAIPAHSMRSTWRGVTLFLLSTTGYIACWIAAMVRPESQMTWESAGITLFTCTLFVIGHDACHGSLTSNRLLNGVLGRISFLPAYHPFSSWEHSHNHRHHIFTNVRGLDPVFAPLSKSEYDALAPSRRCLYRFYRTTAGMGLYYFLEIWWKLEIFPSKDARPRGHRSRHFLIDRFCVAAFLAAQCAMILAISEGTRTVMAIFALIVVPFAGFNALIGFVIFLHHTHPDVPWYKDREDLYFFSRQAQSSVHVVFPRVFELLLHNIMVHTAHHVDVRVPLYQLRDFQKLLENSPKNITSYEWSWQSWRRTLRVCLLYDYETHQWLNFNGIAMTAPLVGSLSPEPICSDSGISDDQ